MANSVDPDETARYEPSHLDLRCLQRYLVWCAGFKGFRELDTLGKHPTPTPSTIFAKGDISYDFLFALLHNKSTEKGSTSKEKNVLPWKQMLLFFSFRIDPFSEGGK